MKTLENLFRIVCTDIDGNELQLTPVITQEGDQISVLIAAKDVAGKKCNILRVESELTTVRDIHAGYMFFPTNFRCGVVRCDFRPREDAQFRSLISAMPVCGICEIPQAVMVHVQGMDSDVRFLAETKENVYQISPEFVLDGDDADEDFLVVYKKMPYATYSDMAKVYRRYQMEKKGCVPLKERALKRKALADAADGIELRIRMGWKPSRTPVRRQTLENEPPMKVACDIPTLHKIIDRMKEAGIHGVEICLVGWGPGGHDGRFPQQYPCDERFGGDEALKAFIKKAQEYGYLVVCHTNSKGAYEIAENWDESLLTKRIGKSGKPEPWLREDYAEMGLQGGDPWHVCAKPAYEHYAKQDLPVVRSYGFEGLHYVDELTAVDPVKCQDEVHPVSRRDGIEYYRKIAQLSTELFGGFQSEAWLDFLNADVDYVLYTSVVSKLTQKERENPLFDEVIPFWMLTYHGIVMAGATSGTINYPIKDEVQHLKSVEYGGRPVMYINSLMEPFRNWMGDEDLLCDSDEAIEKSVKAIKVACDEYDKLKYLQYEFMENHEKLREDVYRVTYSDGTIITVDYTEGTYTVAPAP